MEVARVAAAMAVVALEVAALRPKRRASILYDDTYLVDPFVLLCPFWFFLRGSSMDERSKRSVVNLSFVKV